MVLIRYSYSRAVASRRGDLLFTRCLELKRLCPVPQPEKGINYDCLEQPRAHLRASKRQRETDGVLYRHSGLPTGGESRRAGLNDTRARLYVCEGRVY